MGVLKTRKLVPKCVTWANSRWPTIRDARLRPHIEGDSEAVCADGRILRVSRLFLTFFCRSRGG